MQEDSWGNRELRRGLTCVGEDAQQGAARSVWVRELQRLVAAWKSRNYRAMSYQWVTAVGQSFRKICKAGRS